MVGDVIARLRIYNASSIMPLVNIYLRAGKSPDHTRAIGESVHQALVSEANVPADDRFQIVFEVSAEAIVAHPTYGGARRSEDLVIIEITLSRHPASALTTC
jgi:hypothetical protein